MFDILIRDGTIYDGTGSPPVRGDIGVIGDRIVMMGDLTGITGDLVLEAEGRAVAPGFIDIHTHSDLATLSDPRALSKIAQGVTTEVIGNCGQGVAPVNDEIRDSLKASAAYLAGDAEWTWNSFGDYLKVLRESGSSINLAPLAAHGTIRACVMGFTDRPATAGEIARMQQLTDDAFRAGALGLSSGLIYPPGCYAEGDELIELCRVVKSHDGLYATHIRNETDDVVSAVREALEAGRQSGAAVEIAHHKAAGRRNWGKVRETLPMIEAACREGLGVSCDVYPYTAGSTVLSALLPIWAMAGGVDSLIERAQDPAARERILDALGLEWDQVRITGTWLESNRPLEGKTIAEIARMRGRDGAEAVLELVVEERARVTVAMFSMCDEDMEAVLSHPLSAIGSDGVAVAPDGPLGRGKPHPRFYGTFPRVLGRYCREKRLFSLEEAVRKMTSAPARRLGLRDRGILAEGKAADIVIFDPTTVEDTATYETPHRLPTGIHYVLVNGSVVWEPAGHTGQTAGRVLRR
ncbi:MAG: D-aminoacylase [Armatimonadetes bacterium]|nr:D-aminoacylase [Armatimonadota bacterium]